MNMPRKRSRDLSSHPVDLTERQLTQWLKAWAPQSDCLGVNPTFATHLCCDLGQVVQLYINFLICKMGITSNEAVMKMRLILIITYTDI